MGARACPPCGGPAHHISRAHCCSEISCSLAWDRGVPSYHVWPRGGTAGVLVVKRRCTAPTPAPPQTHRHRHKHTHTIFLQWWSANRVIQSMLSVCSQGRLFSYHFLL